MYYILGIDPHIFSNVSVQDPRYNSDHYMVLGSLHRTPLRKQTDYLVPCTGIPLRTPTTPTREDRIFATLREVILNLRAREASKNSCILESTWRFINTRVSLHQDPAQDQTIIHRLSRAIYAILKSDHQQRTEEAGGGIELLLATDPLPSTSKPGTI